jgi:hypothetical protein
LHRDDRASLARNQHIQLVDSLGQQLAMYSFGSAGMNLQLFSLNFWSKNKTIASWRFIVWFIYILQGDKITYTF